MIPKDITTDYQYHYFHHVIGNSSRDWIGNNSTELVGISANQNQKLLSEQTGIHWGYSPLVWLVSGRFPKPVLMLTFLWCWSRWEVQESVGVTANMLSRHLPPDYESLADQTAISSNNARSDLNTRGFWTREQMISEFSTLCFHVIRAYHLQQLTAKWRWKNVGVFWKTGHRTYIYATSQRPNHFV